MKLRPTTMTEALGWIGVVAILAAYALLTLRIWSNTSMLYFVFNGIGAVGILIDALAQKNWQPAVLNLFWLILAVIGAISSIVL